MKVLIAGASKGARNTVLTALALFFIFPMYWMFTGSFKNQSAVVQTPPQLLPIHPTWINYIHLIQQGEVIRWLMNSIIIAGGATVLGCILSTMAGYALARKTFRGRNLIFGLIIATLLVPRDMELVPLFTLMRQLHLVNTLISCILPVVVMPFGVFLMKQFSQTIPEELLEAARMDGCSEFRIFFSIFVPLIRPAIAALAIFIFTFAWNDYLWQLVMLSSPTHYSIPVGIASFVSAYVAQYGLQMAVATIGFLPLLIVFLLLQKHFVRGITMGSVKG